MHTKAWSDSAAAAKEARGLRHKRNKVIGEVVLGALSLVSAGVGIFAETKVRSAYADYEGFRVMDDATHNSNWKAVGQWRNLRTISYSCAGLLAVGFGVTFLF